MNKLDNGKFNVELSLKRDTYYFRYVVDSEIRFSPILDKKKDTYGNI